MKKLISFLLCLPLLVSVAEAVNFSGSQSLNGLSHPTLIFKAPVSGYYYVNGQLTLPSLSTNGGVFGSRVVASVSKNGATLLYQGNPGATGFQIRQISLVSNDTISVILTSDQINAISQDGVINAVRGQVYYGNSF